MKTCIVTAAPHTRQPSTADECRELWSDGAQFKVYMGGPTDIRETASLMILGFTHVGVVYQDSNQQVRMAAIELSMNHPLAKGE